ncbi:MAG: hypothetical protein QXS98_04250 [Candidatus Nitrosocaldus sp.]
MLTTTSHLASSSLVSPVDSLPRSRHTFSLLLTIPASMLASTASLIMLLLSLLAIDVLPTIRSKPICKISSKRTILALSTMLAA